MEYLLHAPRKNIAFATADSSITRFLRRQHKWAGVQTESSTPPEYISVSCIRELDKGEVEIDDEILHGDRLAEEIRSLLIRDGFKEPDLHFVGLLIRPEQVNPTRDHGGSVKERIRGWEAGE